MRTFAFVLCAALAGSAASAAPVPKHLLKAAENPDLAALQGKWVLTDVAFDGKSLGTEFAASLELTMEVRGDTMVTAGRRYKQCITATITVDANVNPRRITWSDSKETDLDGKPVENANPNKTAAATYKIVGDTLTIAATNDDENPPTDFAGKGVVAMAYTRVKK